MFGTLSASWTRDTGASGARVTYGQASMYRHTSICARSPGEQGGEDRRVLRSAPRIRDVRGRRGAARRRVQGAGRPGPAAAAVAHRCGAPGHRLQLRPRGAGRQEPADRVPPPVGPRRCRPDHQGEGRSVGQLHGGAGAVGDAARRARRLSDVTTTLGRKVTAEAVGTGMLVAVVVGSGIMAQRLSPGDLGMQLLENSTATAGGLVALILAFGSISGAHFNPVVSLADRCFGGLSTRELVAYVPAQIVGACIGAVVANLMFELAAVNVSDHTRSSGGLWLGEVVATFGLLIVILGVVRSGR